ncbi:hypothetical protein HYU89_04555 [Candidatus Collierbacteria bacterium]|nr:hypothetical protein [Candidatus Collierbacteria bacterium]
MPAGINGSEEDQGISRQETDQPETSESARTSFLTYMAFGMLAINGAIEVANGIAMDDGSKMFYGGVDILIAALAYFATPHRYRRV